MRAILMDVDNKMKGFGHGWSHTFPLWCYFHPHLILKHWWIKTNKSTHAGRSTGCTYDVVAGILGSSDCQHQNQWDNSGEPGQGGDLGDHLDTQTHTPKKKMDTIIYGTHTDFILKCPHLMQGNLCHVTTQRGGEKNLWLLLPGRLYHLSSHVSYQPPTLI